MVNPPSSPHLWYAAAAHIGLQASEKRITHPSRIPREELNLKNAGLGNSSSTPNPFATKQCLEGGWYLCVEVWWYSRGIMSFIQDHRDGKHDEPANMGGIGPSLEELQGNYRTLYWTAVDKLKVFLIWRMVFHVIAGFCSFKVSH
jgi:hypothetical protein